MTGNTKLKLFEAMIWKHYSQEKDFDLIRHKLLRARAIMIERHKSFSKMSVDEQFDYASTIVVIAVQSSTKAIRKIRIISEPSKEPLKYALEEGYEKPIIIQSRLLTIKNS